MFNFLITTSQSLLNTTRFEDCVEVYFGKQTYYLKKTEN